MRLSPRCRHLLCLSPLVLLAVLGCQLAAPQSRPATATRLPTAVTSARPYTVYFTDPDDPHSQTRRGGPDQALAEAIRAAQVSVDVAVLRLNLWSIRDALLEARQRGVEVRLVTESDYLDEKAVQALIEAGIPVSDDRSEGLMHDKFTVIDRQEVWSGSMNYSNADAYQNNNNLVRIRSAQLAQDYTAEFEEMFLGRRFGPGSPADTPVPILVVEDARLEVCFAPEDGCQAKLEDLLAAARHTIQFLAFSFTSDEISAAMLERAGEGVRVSGVIDASQARSNSGSEFERLQAAGLDVRLDGNPDNMHHKVIIVDGETVVFGSYNFTRSAETRNDENLLVIHNPEIAALFQGEFQKIYERAAP